MCVHGCVYVYYLDPHLERKIWLSWTFLGFKAKPSAPLSHQSCFFVSGGVQDSPTSALFWQGKSFENAVKYRVSGPSPPPVSNPKTRFCRNNLFFHNLWFYIYINETIILRGQGAQCLFFVRLSFLCLFWEMLSFICKNTALSGARACSVYGRQRNFSFLEV